MIRFLNIIMFLVLLVYCSKRAQVSTENFKVSDGNLSSMMIWKLKDTSSTHYPYLPSYKAHAELRVKNDLQFNQISFTKPQNSHYWITTSEDMQYEILPFEIEKNHWYMINHFQLNGQPHYMHFYVDEDGNVVNEELAPIVKSPI